MKLTLIAITILTVFIQLEYVSHAQSLKRSNISLPRKPQMESKSSSWLFILEKDKQWALVLQSSTSPISTQSDNISGQRSAENSASSTRLAQQEGNTSSAHGAVGSSGRARLKSSNDTTSLEEENAEANALQGFVVEGNTDDIPVETPSNKPVSPKKPKSSVSSS